MGNSRQSFHLESLIFFLSAILIFGEALYFGQSGHSQWSVRVYNFQEIWTHYR